MARDGVDISVVHSIATKPAQQTKVNSFAIEANGDPAIIAFGSVHPEAPDAFAELERLAASAGVAVTPMARFRRDGADTSTLLLGFAGLTMEELQEAGRRLCEVWG